MPGRISRMARQVVLHDPAANRFFLLGWASFEMLSRWGARDAGRLMKAVNTQPH
jgi:putative peptide zinc metalloprotease protein